jgi:UDP-N-acetylglucosamine--N-acetylmuramyl-(pentapeptide) pyrophosphoryl-undecaprenol N-acetylglucosamine transferase
MPKVVVAAGGTAGHVVPALAVADALRDRGAAVSFLGTPDRAEAGLVPEAGYEIDFVNLRGLDRRNPLRAAGAAALAARAVPAAGRVLRDRAADVVLGAGGYVAGPAGLAAIRHGVPLVLSEADSHLGLANRLLARRARRVCLAFPIEGREGERYLVTGRPVPRSVLEADRRAARERFGIPPEARCLLVFGGSLGARTINRAALDAFVDGVPHQGEGSDPLPQRGEGSDPSGDRSGTEVTDPAGTEVTDPFWVLHIAGRRDYPDARARVQAAGPERYVLLEYEPGLGDALAASDLVVARAGGSVFEIAAAGRPAILVPYPFATARHQHTNAAWMAEAGAAVVIEDAELTPARTREEAAGLLADPERLRRMAEASRSLARPDAADRIADEVLAAAGADD